jgi:predicted acetyltransferase
VAVALAVRSIRPDELGDWVDAMHVAFHNNRSTAEEVVYRRDVFKPDFERALGAFDGDRCVGTYESFSAELSLPGSTCLTTDAVTSVSVLPTHRRRGVLTRMITHDLRSARERGEAAAILIASEYPIYGHFGFGPATTRTEYAINPALARFTPKAPGTVDLVEPAALRELAPAIFDRFRRVRAGQINRDSASFDRRLGIQPSPWMPSDRVTRCATYTSPVGDVDGYLIYRTEEARDHHRPSSALEIAELISLSVDAYVGLWRFCCEMDLLSSVRAGMRSPDEPLSWLLENPRAAMQITRQTDFLWVRVLDTPRFLSTRRYACEERLVLEVSDGLGLGGGRYALEGGPSGATCRATDAAADLRLGMTVLGAISLGGVNVHLLAEAGLIEEERPGAVQCAERLFRWPVTPWCSTMF